MKAEQDYPLTSTPDTGWDYFPVWDLLDRAKKKIKEIEETIEIYDACNENCDRKIEAITTQAIELLSHLLP